MSPVAISNNPSIAEFLQHTHLTWLENSYCYREDGKLVGIVDARSAVRKDAETVNINDLMELAVNALSEDAVCNLAFQISTHEPSAAFRLGVCLVGHFQPDSDEARYETAEAAAKLDPEYQTPPWQGEALDELCEWMIRWLLRPQVVRLLKQSNHKGVSAVGRFNKRRKALAAARGHLQAAA